MPVKILDPFLKSEKIEKDLREIIFSIARAGKYVANAIRTKKPTFSGTKNESGEKQLELDVLADKIFCNHLRAAGNVAKFASEEQENEIEISSNGKFCICFDPLDGSSLVSTNLAIGSIFGIFPGNNFLGRYGNEILAAGYFIFGPRTILVIGVKNKIFSFFENYIGEFEFFSDNLSILPDSKTFSPGNLRAVNENLKYKKLIENWQERQLTLRYSGGMVPDVHQIFAKNSGIFSYPGFSKYPNGKLRILFECAPFAFLAKIAGGLAKTEQGKNILDQKILALHQRSTIFIGSKNEVENAMRFCA